MANAGFVIGFGDFSMASEISEVAAILSDAIFGRIPFEIIEDDGTGVPTMRLKSPFIGVTVDLFGAEDHYTLEVNTLPSATVDVNTVVCDISPMLAQQLAKIPGLQIIIPTP